MPRGYEGHRPCDQEVEERVMSRGVVARVWRRDCVDEPRLRARDGCGKRVQLPSRRIFRAAHPGHRAESLVSGSDYTRLLARCRPRCRPRRQKIATSRGVRIQAGPNRSWPRESSLVDSHPPAGRGNYAEALQVCPGTKATQCHEGSGSNQLQDRIMRGGVVGVTGRCGCEHALSLTAGDRSAERVEPPRCRIFKSSNPGHGPKP